MTDNTRTPIWRGLLVAIGSAIAVALVGALILKRINDASPNQPQTTLPVPAAPGAGIFTLTTSDDGSPLLSWVESADETTNLRFSQLGEDGWSEPAIVASGNDWFINWADRPSVTRIDSNRLFAHWLVTNPGTAASDYIYGINMSVSDDNGRTWREVHYAGSTNDEANEYTGFLAALKMQGGGVITSYLSAPENLESGSAGGHGHDHVMTVRSAIFDETGALIADTEIDGSACSCCPLALAPSPAGPLVVYRDRSDQEVRDISIMRWTDGRWTEPHPVSQDGWVIEGCPTNGPAIVSNGADVAVAWFTAPDDNAEVRAAFSDNSGASFGSPVRIDEGSPAGYVGVVGLADGGRAVGWIEYVDGGDPAIMVRRVSSTGELGRAITVGRATGGASNGVPQFGTFEGNVLVVWRDGATLQSVIIPELL